MVKTFHGENEIMSNQIKLKFLCLFHFGTTMFSQLNKDPCSLIMLQKRELVLDGLKVHVSPCVVFCLQERNRADPEKLLSTRTQHGLLLCQQQDNRLRHLHRLRSPGKHRHCQQSVCYCVSLRCNQTYSDPVLPIGHRKAVRDGSQHSQD